MYSEELHAYIFNPFKSMPERLYLMFDMTHNLKNVYNNWINKGSFTFPGTCNGSIDSVELDSNEVGSLMTANFHDVHIVYNQENDKNLRIAHKLNAMCLMPNSIARTSPRLALSKNTIYIKLLFVSWYSF